MAETNKALTALSQALKLEQEGRAFYLKAADETLNEEGKDMFRRLADDEQRHAEIVQQQLHHLEGEGRYVLLPELEAPPIDLDQQLFPPDREQVVKKIGREPNDLEVLHLALDNEIRSYDLYRLAAKETDEAAGKQMYTWLANAEMTHFNLLMTNYEAISQGGWMM